MNYYSLLSSWATAIYLFLGCYIYKIDPKAKVNKVFLLWTLAMAEESFCYTFGYVAANPAANLFWYKLSLLGTVIQNGLLLQVVIIITQRISSLRKSWLFLIYGPGLTVVLAQVFFKSNQVVASNSILINTLKLFEDFYCYGLSLISLVLVWQWGKKTNLIREKKQARIFLISGLITFIFCFLNSYPLPVGSFATPSEISHIFILILAVSIWYAIVKYRIPGLVSLVKLEDVADKVTDLIFWIDNNHGIVGYNQQITEKLGYSGQELIGSPISQLMKGRLIDLTQKILIEEDCRYDRGFYCLGKTGDLIPVSLQASVIKEKFGEQVGLLLVCQDKTHVENLRSEIATRKLKEEQLQFLSLHDYTTGLFNRAYFEEKLKVYSERGAIAVGILVCDVDGLKLVNDSLGHKIGDHLLLATTEVLKKVFIDNTVVARIGGDEFAVLIPNCDQASVKGAYNRIKETVDQLNQENPGLHLSLSVGYAISDNGAKTVIDLFKEADNNMYKEKLNHVHSVRNGMIKALLKTLEARDFITEGHTERIEELVVELGEYMQLSKSAITNLRLLGQFHDIGKVGIPDRILFKPGPLTATELKTMRQHSEIGYRIAKSIPDLLPIADFILWHHERWDGEGYPLKLKGEAIPLECRILAVVDAFDSMTNNRPYRQALSLKAAIAELRSNAGTQFDPPIVERFLELLKTKRILSLEAVE